MKFIRTTATAVQKIKMAAKAITLNSNISHTKALEQAAQEAGYADWFHVLRCQEVRDSSAKSTKPLPMDEKVKSYFEYLRNLSRAPIEVHKIKGNVFHEVSIEGHRFRGKVLPTGEIGILKTITESGLMEYLQVYIGAASIRRCDPRKTNSDSEWWICKYSSEEPILDLGNMTEQGRNALSYEFGLPLIPKEGLPDPKLLWSTFANGHESDLFYLSPTFIKLVEWAKRHPRTARSSSAKANHLRQWMDVAMQRSSLVDSQESNKLTGTDN